MVQQSLYNQELLKTFYVGPYEYHCESLIVRIIFSHLFFASEDHS